MVEQRVRRILFTGYAPVHVVCFMPVYRLLRQDARLDIWFSGGFLNKTADGDIHDLQGFYEPFAVPSNRVMPYESAREEAFDVCVCAHLSTGLLPPGARRSVQIFHGVSFRNLLARDGKALKFDLLCLPGQYHGRMLQRLGLIREQAPHATITGFPKCDALADGSLDRAQILTALGVDPSRPTVLYAPTGGRKNSLETMGIEVIQRLGARTDWNLLIKPHDHPKKKIDWFARLEPMQNERVRLIRSLDLVPFLYAADLLLSDASSAAVEYTLMDRPMVFLDVPELLDKVRTTGDALDLETYGRQIGTCVTDPDGVVDAIAAALSRPDREGEIRRAMARDVFHAPGGAARRVAEVILYAAGLVDEPGADIAVLEPERPPVA